MVVLYYGDLIILLLGNKNNRFYFHIYFIAPYIIVSFPSNSKRNIKSFSVKPLYFLKWEGARWTDRFEGVLVHLCWMLMRQNKTGLCEILHTCSHYLKELQCEPQIHVWWDLTCSYADSRCDFAFLNNLTCDFHLGNDKKQYLTKKHPKNEQLHISVLKSFWTCKQPLSRHCGDDWSTKRNL